MITDNTAQWKLRRISNVINNFEGYWQAQEAVEVGTLRFPRGQNNTGYILECVEAGTTGTTQPEIISDENEIANYGDLGVVGRMRMIFNMAEKDVDEVLAMGVAYNRLTYPELWEWAQKRSGLVITESEWMAKYKETGGKFVPYYSSGDDKYTFRTPLLGAYLKGAENAGDVGEYKEAGLPNITGRTYHVVAYSDYEDGAIRNTTKSGTNSGVYTSTDASYDVKLRYLDFDASRSNSIYGNSDTVTPETMVGIWVIKAVGIVVDSGNTDIAQLLTVNEQTQERVSVVEDIKANKGALSMPSSQWVDISSDINGFQYTAPVDGWVASRFETNTSTYAFFERFRDGLYVAAVPFANNAIDKIILTPVAKGDFFKIDRQGATKVYYDRFYYAQSEV